MARLPRELQVNHFMVFEIESQVRHYVLLRAAGSEPHKQSTKHKNKTSFRRPTWITTTFVL